MYLLNPRIPHEHPLSNLVALLAPELPRLPSDLPSPELGLDSASSFIIYEAVPYPHGHLGL